MESQNIESEEINQGLAPESEPVLPIQKWYKNKRLIIIISILILCVIAFLIYKGILVIFISKQPGIHIIYNGKDLGVYNDKKIDWVEPFILAGDHYLIQDKCTKDKHDHNFSIGDTYTCTYIYDGKKLGEGGSPYFNDYGALVYNNKLLSQPTKNLGSLHSINMIDNEPHLIINNVDRGVVRLAVDEKSLLARLITFDKDNFGYITKSGEVIYNSEKVGDITRISMYRHLYLSDSHYAFIDINNHVIYDGQDLGEGTSVRIYNDNYAFKDPDGYIIYNGKKCGLGTYTGQSGYVSDLDKGREPILSGDNLGYIVPSGYIVYNCKEVGFGGNLQLAKDNYGFETKDGEIIYNGKNEGKGYGLKVSGDSYGFFRKID